MDFKQIQELIKMVNKSNIGELTVELKDFRVTIKQKEDRIQQVVSAPMQTAPVMPQIQHTPVNTAASSTRIFTTFPFTSLSISLNNFMASIIQTTLPGEISSPTSTKFGLSGPALR